MEAAICEPCAPRVVEEEAFEARFGSSIWPHAEAPPGKSSKRVRLEELPRCTQDTVKRPSYLLGQPSRSMLDSWLMEDSTPGVEGPVVRGIPEGLRVLVPMMIDGDGVLNLCQKMQDTKGSVVALVASEDAVHTFFNDSCLKFTVTTMRYQPAWYQDASKLEHLTRPVHVYTAMHLPLTVYVSDVMEPSFNLHSSRLKSSFHRVWDQGKLAHTPPARRADLMRKIRSYTAAQAQLLVSCSTHEPGKVESSLPGTVYSIQLADMRGLCGSSSVVHRAHQVNRSGEPLSWLQLSSQQGCVYWIWFLRNSTAEAAEGSSWYMRPPSCPCCK